MKKLFITIAFVAATMFASAQLFVGGSLGVDMGGRTSDGTKVEKSFGMTINPTVGFMFADNMGVGVDVLFGTKKTTYPEGDNFWEKTTTIGFAPYFRYIFAELDSFKLYADAKFNFRNEKDAAKDDDGHGQKRTAIGLNIVPGLQYDLTDNLSMVAQLNVLRLGFNSTTYADYEPVEDKTVKSKETNFGIGINEPTPLTVGLVYTF